MSASAEKALGGDRFVIREHIGSGGMGEVFRAFDRERGIDVALKLLRDPEPEKIYRFKREFRAFADVTHPHLVRLYELVSSGQRWFFTMELVDGVDFLSWVRSGADAWTERPPPVLTDLDPVTVSSALHDGDERDSPTVTRAPEPVRAERRRRASTGMPTFAGSRQPMSLSSDAQWARLRDGLRQLAVGIEALHQRDTLHRDVKPSNVLVTREGRLVLLDFGIITELLRPASVDLPGRFYGTPAYMAPEVGTQRPLDEAADWYAVGVILYEAITGRRPFRGPLREIMETKRRRDPPPAAQLVPTVPDDLDRLCTELLAREPSQRPSGAEILARLGARRPSSSPVPASPLLEGALFGRDRHLAILRAALADAIAGEPRVVFLSGPAGSGKSALVAHFLAEIEHDEHATVIAGRCSERESVPFKAVDDLVDSLAQHLAGRSHEDVLGILPRGIAVLARLFPVLEQIPAVREAPRRRSEPSDAHELRRAAFVALRELLVRLSARGPLVLHVDDAQWGDDDSAALLAEVFRAPFAPPAMLVVSYTETGVPAGFVRQLRNPERGDTELEVDDLAPDQARALATELLAAAGAPDRFAETIARDSHGNPLFVAELVRHVAGGADAEHAITLDDIVRRRVADLEPDASRLLTVLAVAGWPVPADLAAAAAELEHDAEAITTLRALHLINVRRGRDGDLLEVLHDRVRDVALAQIAPGALVGVHERLIAALEASPRAILADHLAEHLEAAGHTTRAAENFVRAADDAAAKLAFARAGRLYGRAIGLSSPSGARRADLYVHMADAYQHAGKGVESASAYLAAASDVARVDAIRYRGRAAEQLLRAGQIDDGVAALRDVLAEVGITMPRTRWRAVLSLLALRVWVRLRGLGFRPRPVEQVSPEQITRIDVCWTASVALGMSDTAIGGVFQVRHLIESLRAGEPRHVSHALGIEAVYRSLSGAGARASIQKVAVLARDIADASGDWLSIAWAHGTFALTRYQLGEWRGASEATQVALTAMQGKAGMWFERATVEMYRLWALYWQGRWRELCDRATALRAEAEDIGDLYSVTNLSIGLPAVQWLVRGRPAEGRHAADEAIERWAHKRYHLQHYWYAYAMAQVDLYEGHAVEAWTRLRRTWGELRGALLRMIQMVRLEVLWARGRAAVAAAASLESSSARRPYLRDAAWCARRLRRERRPDAEALALALAAGIAGVRGDLAAALPLITAAADRAAAQDLNLLAAAARAVRGHLVGGERGAALTAEAERWMSDQTIADPQAITRLFVPGLAPARASGSGERA